MEAGRAMAGVVIGFAELDTARRESVGGRRGILPHDADARVPIRGHRSSLRGTLCLGVSMSARRLTLLGAFAFGTLAVACAKPADEAAPAAAPTQHIFAHEPSGVALELPLIWADRYRQTDSITTPFPGLERQLTLRFVKADSTVAEEPLVTLAIFANAQLDTAAMSGWGAVIAKDGERTVLMRPASANPLAPGSADALAFDSLMIALLERQMTASLRAPGGR